MEARMPTYTLLYDDERSTDLMEEFVEAQTVSQARTIAESRLTHLLDVSRILIFQRSVEVGAVWRRQ